MATRDLGWDAADMNWFSANLEVVAALAEAGYDHREVEPLDAGSPF